MNAEQKILDEITRFDEETERRADRRFRVINKYLKLKGWKIESRPIIIGEWHSTGTFYSKDNEEFDNADLAMEFQRQADEDNKS